MLSMKYLFSDQKYLTLKRILIILDWLTDMAQVQEFVLSIFVYEIAKIE